MLKKKLLKLKLSKTETGFSLVEILVAGLVSFGFLVGTLQIMVVATYAQVQAKEKSDADTWIKEDSDFIKYLAKNDFGCTDIGYGGEPDDNGYADDLENELGTYASGQPNHDPELAEFANDSRTKYLNNNSSSGRTYTLKRNINANGNVLELTYGVDYDKDTKTCDLSDSSTWRDNCVTANYMEVVPDAANPTNCP